MSVAQAVRARHHAGRRHEQVVGSIKGVLKAQGFEEGWQLHAVSGRGPS